MVIKRCSEKKAQWAIRSGRESSKPACSQAEPPCVDSQLEIIINFATTSIMCQKISKTTVCSTTTMSRIFDSSFANCCAWKIHFLPFSCCAHQLRTCDGYFPYSLWPISYLGYIWVRPENFFFRKNNQMDKGLTVPNIPKMSQNLWPNLSVQAQKFGIS